MGLLVMILGLALFLGVHTLTTRHELRARMIASIGEGGYKVGYALASIYGGYFGAGQGIVLMTIVTLSGVEDLQEANPMKNAVATIVSLIAVIILAFKGLILWKYGILMVFGAILGGYLGGRFAKGLSKQALRYFVLSIASFFTVVYFWNTYVH